MEKFIKETFGETAKGKEQSLVVVFLFLHFIVPSVVNPKERKVIDENSKKKKKQYFYNKNSFTSLVGRFFICFFIKKNNYVKIIFFFHSIFFLKKN